MTSITNMWVNIGRSQFHLPTNKPQVVRGHVGIVVPDREALVNRLTRLRKRLDGTCFDFTEHDMYVEARCPWGNRIRCYEPDPYLGPMTLGIAYVEFDVPPGSADGHRAVLSPRDGSPGCDARKTSRDPFANVSVGIGAEFPLPRDRSSDSRLRRPSRAGLCRRLLGTASRVASRRD